MDFFEFICRFLVFFLNILLYNWFVDFYCEMQIRYTIYFVLLKKYICIDLNLFYWFIYWHRNQEYHTFFKLHNIYQR
jgi:hypothetical protein